MNVLIIGKDPTLFERDKGTFGDTRKRHIAYVRKLRRRCPGSNVRIITYTPKSPTYKIEEIEDGLTLYPTNSRYRILFLLGAVRTFFKVTKNWKPDLITVQTPYEEGFIGYFLSQIARSTYFPQLHFDLSSEYWRKEHWLNGLRRHIASWVLKNADGVRVVSEALKAKVIDKLGLNPDKVFVIPVGVNFRPAPRNNKEKYKTNISGDLASKPIVLFVGRFYPPKNLEDWVEVAHRVIDNNPDVRFVLVGEGVLLPRIKELVKRKSLSNYFYFLGTVGHSQLPEVYAAADVFLLTSFYEGFGRVIVESYLSGVPAVCTKCTGPDDLIENGITGFMHDIGDVDSLSKSVNELIKNKELWKQMSEKGKEKIESNYSLEKLVNKLISSWMDLCRAQE